MPNSPEGGGEGELFAPAAKPELRHPSASNPVPCWPQASWLPLCLKVTWFRFVFTK